MTKSTKIGLDLEVKFHDRCKCNRHKTKKTRVYVNAKLTDSSGNCIEEHDWIIMCRLKDDGSITWEHDIPEVLIDEIIKMYPEEEVVKIFENLPVRKKF